MTALRRAALVSAMASVLRDSFGRERERRSRGWMRGWAKKAKRWTERGRKRVDKSVVKRLLERTAISNTSLTRGERKLGCGIASERAETRERGKSRKKSRLTSSKPMSCPSRPLHPSIHTLTNRLRVNQRPNEVCGRGRRVKMTGSREDEGKGGGRDGLASGVERVSVNVWRESGADRRVAS